MILVKIWVILESFVLDKIVKGNAVGEQLVAFPTNSYHLFTV